MSFQWEIVKTHTDGNVVVVKGPKKLIRNEIPKGSRPRSISERISYLVRRK